MEKMHLSVMITSTSVDPADLQYILLYSKQCIRKRKSIFFIIIKKISTNIFVLMIMDGLVVFPSIFVTKQTRSLCHSGWVILNRSVKLPQKAGGGTLWFCASHFCFCELIWVWGHIENLEFVLFYLNLQINSFKMCIIYWPSCAKLTFC